MFNVVPAIDLREKKCVRLFKGQIGTETCYYENPVDALKYWKKLGATVVHVVDLDAATGIGSNKQVIKELLEFAGKVELQVGGGIRNDAIATEYLQMGVARVVIGTAAIKSPNLIKRLSSEHGSERIIVALDHKDEKVQIKGWTQDSGKDIYEMGALMEDKGAGFILFSSVEADGAFTGPDFVTTKKMVEAVNLPIIAAGGTRSLEDIAKLREIGAAGVVIGKALYEGKIDLANAFHFNIF
ncbi:MAG: 1-(5-phosphoribosyl)-5-[(5-phosphoribosylamino)methylideneamino]imidazole-4-carboxamide isomerase [Promethearchaeota archaeon]